MSNKESCGKTETSQRKDITSLSNFDEEDKRDKRTSASSMSSSCSRRYVSSEKRKLPMEKMESHLERQHGFFEVAKEDTVFAFSDSEIKIQKKSDHIDIPNCNIKRRQDPKRPNVDPDIPRKRPKLTSSSQGPVTLQEASYSHDNQIISQSPSSDGTKKHKSKCVDLKMKDIKPTNVRSNLDHGIKNRSSSKITKDVKLEAEGQAGERAWPRVLAQREKMKEPKKERHNKYRDSSEKRAGEKSKRIQFSQDYNSNKISKEPCDSRRKKVSFKIPVKSHDTHQKLLEENVFLLDSSKSRTKQKKKGRLESFQGPSNSTRHQSKHLFSDSTYKQTVHEWKGKSHHEHQESNDSTSSENLTPIFEARCSSVSYEIIQDTDEEMQIVEELHAARVGGKSVDLPVVPPPGELSSMEIDLVEDDMHSSAANTASDKHLLIVIDTNILMNHLKFVRILKTTEIPGFDRLVLIIPWVVVQELDRMKAGKLLKYAQHKALPAVRFINDSLRDQDRKLWGQSIQLASQKLYGLSDENNDDRVLKCCLQYQELFPSSLVILCTDDRNLRNKGLISGVKSLSKEELSAEFLSWSSGTAVCHQACAPKPQLNAEAVSSGESNEEKSTNSGLLILLESIVSDLEKTLGTALSSILETEMKIAFGNLWMEMLYLKPPWTLMHLIQCFKKHWLAVFGLIMEKNLLLTVESLYENLCKANNAVDFATVKFLLQDSQSLLHAFSTRSNYDGVLPQAFARVNTLLQTFAEAKAKLSQNASEKIAGKKQEATSPAKSNNQELTVFSGSHPPQPNKHQEIWSVLESVWITIYENSTDVFQRLGSNSAQTSSKIASFEEAFIYLQKLMAAVKNILEGIQRILVPNSSYQDVETLYNVLIKYKQINCLFCKSPMAWTHITLVLQLYSRVNESVKFTAQELYDCLSQTEYRERLTIGCRQLEEMQCAMQQCHASVYPEARNRGWCEDTLGDRTGV